MPPLADDPDMPGLLSLDSDDEEGQMSPVLFVRARHARTHLAHARTHARAHVQGKPREPEEPEETQNGRTSSASQNRS